MLVSEFQEGVMEPSDDVKEEIKKLIRDARISAESGNIVFEAGERTIQVISTGSVTINICGKEGLEELIKQISPKNQDENRGEE